MRARPIWVTTTNTHSTTTQYILLSIGKYYSGCVNGVGTNGFSRVVGLTCLMNNYFEHHLAHQMSITDDSRNLNI